VAVPVPERETRPPAKTVKPVVASEIVALEAAAASRFVKSGDASEITVRLRVRAEPVKDAPRPPINLALVVDTSGSMEGKSIEDARAASLALVDALSPGDRLAVVAYHSTAEVLVPSTLLDTKSIARVKERIGGMKAQGTTDMAGGLRAGLGEVLTSFQQSGVNRVVLLGDGVPNNEAEILPLAQSAGQRAVSITTRGLGLDYNETLMAAVAQQSGGGFHFIKESSAVASVFKEEVLRLKQVVSKGAVLRLATGPGVSVKSVVGLPASISSAGANVTLGDMSEGDQRDVIVRLSATGRRPGSVVELLDAVLTFNGTAAGVGQLEERSFLAVRATDDKAELASGRDLEVERSAARVSVADMILRAISLARAGNLTHAQMLLDSAEKEALRAAKALDDPELTEKAKSVGPLRESLPSLVQKQMAAAATTSPVPQAALGRAPRPMAAAPRTDAAADAAVVMESHTAAVRTIQGL
jgi:Ca-activated chloride channel family protein